MRPTPLTSWHRVRQQKTSYPFKLSTTENIASFSSNLIVPCLHPCLIWFDRRLWQKVLCMHNVLCWCTGLATNNRIDKDGIDLRCVLQDQVSQSELRRQDLTGPANFLPDARFRCETKCGTWDLVELKWQDNTFENHDEKIKYVWLVFVEVHGAIGVPHHFGRICRYFLLLRCVPEIGAIYRNSPTMDRTLPEAHCCVEFSYWSDRRISIE